MRTTLNRTSLNSWLPWAVLFATSSALQLFDAYPGLRLDLPTTVWPWIYTNLTCHLVHITTRHWLYNSLALVMIALIFHKQFNWCSWLLTYVFSATSISLGLIVFSHTIRNYAGLSGVLHGFFATGCLLLYPQQRTLAISLGLLLVLKLLLEPLTGSLFIPHPGFAVVHSAHVFGVIGGVLSWSVYTGYRCRHDNGCGE